MPRNTNEERRQLEERLARLAGAVRFTWGQPAYWSDGEIEVCVDRVWNTDAELEHLVTVAVVGRLMPSLVLQNLPWTVARATGETIRQAETDRRGQFRLHGLDSGEYQLCFAATARDVLLATPEMRGAWESTHRWEISFSLAASGQDYGEAPFASPDGLTSGSLEWSSNNLKLVVERQAATVGDRLVRFQLQVDDLLVQGFVGLYQFEEGKERGEVLLTVIDAALRQRDPTRCSLSLVGQALGGLQPGDRADLERSRQATVDRRSRQVLDEALEALKKGG